MMPVLQADLFSDADVGDTHLKTAWQISTAVDFSTLVFETETHGHLTLLSVPEYVVDQNTTYYWRAQYYDNYYRPSGWSTAFSFATLVNGDGDDSDSNGIPDTQQLDPVADVDVDMDGVDGPDISQANIACVHTVVGNGMIGVKRSTNVIALTHLKSVDPAAITETAGKPGQMPLGLINLKATVATPGDVANVIVYLSDPSPATEWFAYDPINGWRNYIPNPPHHAIFTNSQTVTVQVRDGGFGDADGIANGVVILLSGFGLPASGPPNTPSLASPANAATDQLLTPTLQTGGFSDPDAGNTHFKTQWQVSTAADFTTTLLDITSDTQLTQLTIPDFTLANGTTYYWRAKFFDNYFTESAWPTAYSFTTQAGSGEDANANGIPDAQELNPAVTARDLIVDMDNNGMADTGQSDIKVVHTLVDPFGTGMIGVLPSTNVSAIDSMKSVDPVDITDTTGKPDEMPLGMVSLKLSTVSPGDIADVIFYFSDPAPLEQWYTYDSVNGWTDYSSHATFNPDGMSATIQVQDGGFGDADGIANGVILINSGFGFASSPNAPNTPSVTYPADLASDVSLTATLQSDSFVDADSDAHFKTRWQISTVPFSTPPAAADLILDVTSDFHLTSLPVPEYVFKGDAVTTYYLRVSYIDDFYTASAWSASHQFTTVADADDADGDGIPDTQELNDVATPSDATVDIDADATYDIVQSDIRDVHTAVGDGIVGIKFSAPITVDTLKSIDPATITDTVGKPDQMPLGLIAYRLGNVTAGEQVTVTVYLSAPAPGEWYKHDPVNGWQDYTPFATFANGGLEVTLLLQDGGIGDADGIANGIIVDPSGFGFATSNPPVQPTLTSPADLATNVVVEPTLVASAFTDPDSDSHLETEWQISDSATFGTLVHSDTGTSNLTSLTLAPGILQAHTTYYWRVRYTDEYYAVSPWSATSSFTTLNHLPAVPSLLSPADGSTDTGLMPTLQTGAFSDTDSDTHLETEWQVSTTPDFSALLLHSTSAAQLISLTLPHGLLDQGTTYYWRARHIDDQNDSSAWPAEIAFTTLNYVDGVDPEYDGNANGVPDSPELEPGRRRHR